MKIRILLAVSALLITCSLTAKPPAKIEFKSTSIYVSVPSHTSNATTQATALMYTGSRYASCPYSVGIQEVNALYETTYSKSANPQNRHIRKGGGEPPPDDDDDYDPENPHFGSIADGTWLLVLFACVFVIYKYKLLRRVQNLKKQD